MTINPVQINVEDKKSLSYKKYKKAIKTDKNVKPLAPQGHLVHDNLLSIPKFWIQDIAYDMRAVKEGFQGKTNDHQQGRLNDVGLRLGGIGIAAYLASRTSDPKLRLMEYVGLASFLAAMSLYPKIAINLPSRIVHGFDIGKEYIDDQGRKKSVFQDSNYIPFDMYKGEYPGEDLDIIGDRMGIPRDIKNRHDLIKEQMRKIATQNNTLWMLTAGFATPVMAALMCVGLEKLLLPAMEMMRNSHADRKITSILDASNNMKELKTSAASQKIENILTNSMKKELSKEDFDKIISILCEETDNKISGGIKDDLTRLLKADPLYKTDGKTVVSIIQKNLSGRNKTKLEAVFVLKPEEIDAIIKKIAGDTNELSKQQIKMLRSELKNVYDTRIKDLGYSGFYSKYKTDVLSNMETEILKTEPVAKINETQRSQVVNFAKIIDEFKTKEKLVDELLSFKFEEAPETILARSYAKFENVLFDVLDIKFKDMAKIKESHDFAEKIIAEKIKNLTADETKYQKAIKRLSEAMVDMDIKLNGKDGDKILNLIHATENIYNNTAKRLNELNGTAFAKTIKQLIQQDANENLEHIITDKEELTALLDGTLKPKKELADWSLEYAIENSRGVGSSKNDAISRILDRYQGVRNSFNRILLTLDVFRREIPAGGYEKEVAESGKKYILTSDSSQFTQKFKLDNNPSFYRDIMRNTWGDNKLTQDTKNAMEGLENGNFIKRFEAYIKRFRQVIGNNNIDFTKPHHIVGEVDVNKEYAQQFLTRRSMFDLVAQSPIDMIMGGSARKYGSLDWLRKASAIGAAVLGVAVIAQFFFGRIKHPQNIQKQVNDDENK